MTPSTRPKGDSEHISVRLHGGYPGESQANPELRAITILREWESQGHSRRAIITRALLALDGQSPNEGEPRIQQLNEVIVSLQTALDRIYTMLDRSINTPVYLTQEEHDQIKLDREFVQGVRGGMLPGIGQKSQIEDE